MSEMTLGIFLVACFVGGLTSGIAGFAMALVLTGIWLHFLPPLQVAVLAAGYGALTQGYAIWKLRGSLSWRRFWPLVAGSALGVPVGTLLLTAVDAADMRVAIGVLLVLYTAYCLAAPSFKAVQGGVAADIAAGGVNGVVGGLTGLSGIVAVVWCQLRKYPKDVARAVFQPVTFVTALMAAVSLTTAGAVTRETAGLFLLGLPVVLAGLWAGFKLYGTLDEAAFRKVVLALLLLSGLALVAPRG